MKKIVLLISGLLLLLSTVNAQDPHVSAYQAGSYQPGVMNLRDLSVPDPGLIFIVYNYWNKSKSFYDQNGNNVEHIVVDRDLIKTTLDLSPQISGFSSIPVVFYASTFKILGARYMASVNPVFMTSGYRMNIHASTSDTNVVSNSNLGGFGDLPVLPLGLGWSFKNINLSFFYTVYIPTGRYHTGATDNLGKGYWTHQFQLPTYFYFLDKATALLVMPTFEINSLVKDSDVRAGSRFTIEYGISQYVTPWLELEVLNGHNFQISDDTGDDVWWRDTPLDARDQTSTVSFGVGAWPVEGRLNLRLKYAFDYGVKQRYKSDFWAFSIVFIPNILTGKKGSTE